MAFRAALHQAGAAALSQLLQFPEPAADQRTLPCPCGSQAHYRELRSRRILTALGEVALTRPWYLCPRCHNGQFPVDRQLDVENRDCSAGVRRMDAIVGQQGPFDRGREQMKVLAGLDVTAKSVERTAEAIGGDIAAREQRKIRKAVQLDLPVIVGEPILVLNLVATGQVSALELARIQHHHLAAILEQQIRASNDLAVTRAALNDAVGFSLDRTFELTTPLESSAGAPEGTLEEYRRLAAEDPRIPWVRPSRGWRESEIGGRKRLETGELFLRKLVIGRSGILG
jgi:hypothetical protein